MSAVGDWVRISANHNNDLGVLSTETILFLRERSDGLQIWFDSSALYLYQPSPAFGIRGTLIRKLCLSCVVSTTPHEDHGDPWWDRFTVKPLAHDGYNLSPLRTPLPNPPISDFLLLQLTKPIHFCVEGIVVKLDQDLNLLGKVEIHNENLHRIRASNWSKNGQWFARITTELRFFKNSSPAYHLRVFRFDPKTTRFFSKKLSLVSVSEELLDLAVEDDGSVWLLETNYLRSWRPSLITGKISPLVGFSASGLRLDVSIKLPFHSSRDLISTHIVARDNHIWIEHFDTLSATKTFYELRNREKMQIDRIVVDPLSPIGCEILSPRQSEDHLWLMTFLPVSFPDFPVEFGCSRLVLSPDGRRLLYSSGWGFWELSIEIPSKSLRNLCCWELSKNNSLVVTDLLLPDESVVKILSDYKEYHLPNFRK